MDISVIIEKYNLSEDHINSITAAILEDKPLKQLKNLLPASFTLNTAYTAARLICEEFFGESIAEVAPTIALDRAALSKRSHFRWQEEKTKKIEQRRRELAEEDMAMYLSELAAKQNRA